MFDKTKVDLQKSRFILTGCDVERHSPAPPIFNRSHTVESFSLKASASFIAGAIPLSAILERSLL